MDEKNGDDASYCRGDLVLCSRSGTTLNVVVHDEKWGMQSSP